MEEKLAHKDEECEALKNIVIAAQKDGNINGLISAADSNLLLSKVISLFWMGSGQACSPEIMLGSAGIL